MAHLVIRLDPDHYFHAEIDRSRTNLGSGGWAQDVHVSIAHASVAEMHASVEAIEGGYMLVDRSGGRTWAAGRKVTREVTLVDDMTVQLGEVYATFHEDGAPHEPRTARDAFAKEEALPDALWLVVRGPGSRTPLQRVAIEDELVLGSARDADVRLAHATVSGRHARLVRERHGLRLFDLKSRNGTQVNQLPIDACGLPLGAVIRIGPFELQALAEEEKKAAAGLEEFHGLLFADDSMRRALALIPEIAQESVPAVVMGETGTGKEAVARAIHALSPRSGGPFMAVNCSAVAESLFESELFGHEKGAFSGADADKDGLFVAADGGTLFLDEVGELPLAMQAKLLRALQEGEIRPVGATKPVKVDVRIVTATHRDLRRLASTGGFREDLYYRLVVAPVLLPPLRERGDDAVLLFEHFLRLARPRAFVPALTEAAKARLRAHRWPGNVRELSNTASRLRFTTGWERTLGPGAISFDPLAHEGPPPSARDPDAVYPLGLTLDQIEKAALAIVLRQNAGSRRAAAEQLAISRTTLLKKLREYGIDPGG